MPLFRSLTKRGNDLYDTLRYDYATTANAAPDPLTVGTAIPVMEYSGF